MQGDICDNSQYTRLVLKRACITVVLSWVRDILYQRRAGLDVNLFLSVLLKNGRTSSCASSCWISKPTRGKCNVMCATMSCPVLFCSAAVNNMKHCIFLLSSVCLWGFSFFLRVYGWHMQIRYEKLCFFSGLFGWFFSLIYDLPQLREEIVSNA